MRDLQSATYLTRPHAVAGQLDDLMADGDRQRSTVDEDAAQLIDSSLKVFVVAVRFDGNPDARERKQTEWKINRLLQHLSGSGIRRQSAHYRPTRK